MGVCITQRGDMFTAAESNFGQVWQSYLSFWLKVVDNWGEGAATAERVERARCRGYRARLTLNCFFKATHFYWTSKFTDVFCSVAMQLFLLSEAFAVCLNPNTKWLMNACHDVPPDSKCFFFVFSSQDFLCFAEEWLKQSAFRLFLAFMFNNYKLVGNWVREPELCRLSNALFPVDYICWVGTPGNL